MVKFRTEICTVGGSWKISADEKLLFIGSCFSDEIGRCLAERGFDISVNPFGPLYNPLSIANCFRRALEGEEYDDTDLTQGPRGYHCLDYATRFSGDDRASILEGINSRLSGLKERVGEGAVVFVTLGTSFVYELADGGSLVGNCHKFPASMFRRRMIDVREAADALAAIVCLLRGNGARKLVFTVSPIRHLADGFHENTLSKATLHLAIEHVRAENPDFVDYFPSFEIVMDDLRDYRAYADDLVHISSQGVAYIYEKFEERFFTADTRNIAAMARKKYLSSQHRQILEKND